MLVEVISCSLLVSLEDNNGQVSYDWMANSPGSHWWKICRNCEIFLSFIVLPFLATCKESSYNWYQGHFPRVKEGCFCSWDINNGGKQQDQGFRGAW